MLYCIRKPRPELAELIDVLVFYEGMMPSHELVRYLPDGGMQIVMDMTDRPKYIYDEKGSRRIQKCRRSWLSGLRTEFTSIGVERGQSMMVIEFRPGNTAPFFRFPLSEIADTVVDGDAVFGRPIDDLRERVISASQIDEKFNLVEEWLLDRLDPTRGNAGTVVKAAQLIRNTPTMRTVDRIADHAGISHKHLIASFKRVIGITPKQYQRIHRFQLAIRAIEETEAIRWVVPARTRLRLLRPVTLRQRIQALRRHQSDRVSERKR